MASLVPALDDLGEPDESSDNESTNGKNNEEILQECLLRLVSDQEAVEQMIKQEPSDPTELHPVSVFKMLVVKMKYLWFDLFKALGMDHKALEDIRHRFPLDPEASLFEAISEWAKGEEESHTPSWKMLVDALHYKMLAVELSDAIAEKHFSAQDFEQHKVIMSKSLLHEPLPPSFEEEDDAEFSKLLLEITDQVGPHSSPEFYHCLKELSCPDGTQFIDESYLKERHSTEGLLIPLLYNNLLISQDMDLLIVILRGLGRDDLLPLLYEYSTKLTVGFPIFRPIQDTSRFFSLVVELHPSVTELDLEGASYIKQELCELLGVGPAPFLLQYLGWKKSPIVVQFQVHFSLVDRVKEVVDDVTKTLDKFTRFELDVRGSVFCYNLRNRQQR